MTIHSGSDSQQHAGPTRQLSLFDASCIIVGIVVGAGIFESTPAVARNVPGPAWLVVTWLFGGLVALIGALCYAELATTYPQQGGEYVYLTRAFGRRTGFIFAWAQLWIVRPGSIGAMAYVFANYAYQLWPLPPIVYASAPILVLSGLNILGVQAGKMTQNLLTVVKVMGLMGIVVVALVPVNPTAVNLMPGPASDASAPVTYDFRLAIILVLFSYGGWNDMTYAAAEVRNPEKNLARALLLGTAAVTVIYLTTLVALIGILGLDGIRQSESVAADAIRSRFGISGSRAISGLICISCLGAINGMLFTGARIYSALGAEYRLYARLGTWHARTGTPTPALVLQAAATLAVVIGFGLYEEGFQRMVVFTTPVFWFFFLLTGLSLMVLRVTDPATPRIYRTVGYPLTPIVFCLFCLFTLVCSVLYAIENRSSEAMWAGAILLAGCLLSGSEPPARRPPSSLETGQSLGPKAETTDDT